MQIVIDISEGAYKRHKKRVNMDMCTELDIAVVKGTPLPKGHGDLKDELDLDLTDPSLGTDAYIDDLMAKHNIDYINGDDEDKVKTFAMDLINGCMNVIKTAPTIIEADKEESEDKEV